MGLDAPGTYIPSPAPSGFSDPMPPITVEANGNPSYGPSPTEDEDKEPTKVKRSPIPTKTHYVDSSKFKSLDSTVKNKKWQDKDGWAIQAGKDPFYSFFWMFVLILMVQLIFSPTSLRCCANSEPFPGGRRLCPHHTKGQGGARRLRRTQTGRENHHPRL